MSIEVSERFKAAMKAPVKTVSLEVAFDGATYTSNDVLTKAVIQASGYYFGVATKSLSLSLIGVDFNLMGKTGLATLKVKAGNDWESCVLGKFKVLEQTVDLEKEMTSIKAYDAIGVVAEKYYLEGGLVFPTTVNHLASQLASASGMDYDEIELVNGNYSISEDLYAKINNITYRDILAEVAGASANLAMVRGSDNALNFVAPMMEPLESLSYDNLKKIKFEPKYGDVSSVVLARTPQEDNIVVEDADEENKPAGKNIFNKSDYTFSPYWDDNGVLRNGGSSMKGVVIPCEPNSVYIIKKSAEGTNQRFAVFTTESAPAAGVAVVDLAGLATGLNTATQYEIATSSNAHYLCLFLGVANTTPSMSEMVDDIYIEKVEKADRKNLWKYDSEAWSNVGVTARVRDDGAIVLNGTLTSGGHVICDRKFDISPLLNKLVRLSTKTSGVGHISNIGVKRNYTSTDILGLNDLENDSEKSRELQLASEYSTTSSFTLDIYFAASLAGTVFADFVIEPFLEFWNEPVPFEPFIPNGVVEVKLANNEILDDNREELAQPILEAIKGFGFTPFEATTEGHGWHEIGDRLRVFNKSPRVPIGYQEVEYIENTSNAYFKLEGVPLDATSEIELDCLVAGADTDFACLWCSRTGIGSADSFNSFVQISQDSLRIDYGGNQQVAGNYRDARHKFKHVRGKYYVDNVIKSNIADKAFSKDGFTTLWASSVISGSNYGNYGRGRIYGAKISNDGVQQLDLVPCVRKADGKVGLFDTINNTFHESKGSGSFNAGAKAGVDVDFDSLADIIVTDIKLTIDGGLKEELKGIAPDETQTNYALAGGIKKTIYNTEIKVDKQGQEITSIVSRQDTFEDETLENFTQVVQNISSVVTTIQSTGGGNLIHNSVGYNKDTDGALINWTQDGTVGSETSPESVSYGAISGNQIDLGASSSIVQRIVVDSSGAQKYSLGFKAKKGATGVATVHLRNDIDDYYIAIPANKSVLWESYGLAGVTPHMAYFDVVVETDSEVTDFAISDLILTVGDSNTPWVSASDEILSKSVAVDGSGVTVKSSSNGDYVQLDELGLNGYSDATGSLENVFTVNRDLTEVSKLKARNQITMPPLKIVPVTSGDRAGWSFVKESE